MDNNSPQDAIVKELIDGKAVDIKRYDMEGKSSVTDFVVVCQATSTAHAKGLSDRVYLALKKTGKLPLGVEGAEEGSWILLDYDTVIIHIFLDESREHYGIDTILNEYSMESF